ncbi:stage III sporulation protein AC [Oceanirhabdus sp. W0125-5]|uniref:stage III sporulation protein AC n=1 Tax=Oceanirhabdus sp. W0125-5 TaxID=2999116 RepID=UPI0022F30EF9|nr:stage III sporulation protein AC [Oceanirhabdus sp. W0125-5]WBW95333.1 stage III sporulation protein AC [Oceanirhabdus sp. W0125-5]
MEISLILKIAGIGFLLAVIDKVLTGAGKKDWAQVVDLVGVIVVILMILSLIGQLFTSVKTIFQL